MTDEQVKTFIDGCKLHFRSCQMSFLLTRIDYPSYELYTDLLRNGIWGGGKGKQLRLVVGKDRKVKEVEEI